jgi:hypothetical protein
MFVAVCMHIRVNDPLKKVLPALMMLFSSLIICIGSLYRA